MADQKVSLKLLIDTKGHKVLFAEAGKDFVDFLFNILSLPLGTVIRLLTKQGMVGCLGNLYESIENLNETYMQPNQGKDTLLKPKAPICGANYVPLLLPNVESSKSENFYRCAGASGNSSSLNFGGNSTSCSMYVASNPSAICPQCKKVMNTLLSFVHPPADNKASPSGEAGYVKGVVTYMVMDDLVVSPMSTISSITLLNKFNVKELGALEEKVIDFGIEEALKLLKASLQSKTVLTDVFLGKKGANDITFVF